MFIVDLCCHIIRNANIKINIIYNPLNLFGSFDIYFDILDIAICITVCASIGGVLDTPPTQLLKMLGVFG